MFKKYKFISVHGDIEEGIAPDFSHKVRAANIIVPVKCGPNTTHHVNVADLRPVEDDNPQEQINALMRRMGVLEENVGEMVKGGDKEIVTYDLKCPNCGYELSDEAYESFIDVDSMTIDCGNCNETWTIARTTTYEWQSRR